MSLLDNFCIENQTRIYTDTKARFSFGERSRARLVEVVRRGFIGLSAFVPQRRSQSNLAAHEKLKQAVRIAGYQFYELDDACPGPDQALPQTSLSLLIPWPLEWPLARAEVLARNLARRFRSYYVVLAEPDMEMRVFDCVREQVSHLRPMRSWTDFFMAYRIWRLHEGFESARAIENIGLRQPENWTADWRLQEEGILF